MQTLNEISIVVNPISGTSSKKKLIQEIENRLKDFSFKLVFTERPGHATELAQRAVADGKEIVIVAGGDGSINEVAQALVHSKTTLAIIPTGSGNGLARHLNIPKKITEAIDIIKKNKNIAIDTILINDRYCLSVAGVGFDAEIGWDFAQLLHRGFLGYFLLTLKKFSSYQPCHYDLCIDGKNFSTKAFLVAFANSSQFGNNFYIAPTAQINDGLLDVIIVKKIPLYATARAFHQLLTKSLEDSKYVEIIKCKQASVIQKNLKGHIDGEPLLFQNGINAQIFPSSLKVIVP